VTDLHHLLRDERDLRAREIGAATGAAQAHAVLNSARTTVRRRRRNRTLAAACAAVLVVAGIGGGTWALTRDAAGPLLPITSPTPSPSETPSPTPSPSPTLSPTPSGPQPLTDAVSAQIGKGWIVGTHVVDDVRHAAAISPEGVVYIGPELGADVFVDGWMYERGFAANVSVSPEMSEFAAVDVETGEVTVLEPEGSRLEELQVAFGIGRLGEESEARTPGPRFIGQKPDGTILWAGVMYYGALVGLATETASGVIEGMTVNDEWTPPEAGGEVWETVVFDSATGTVYLLRSEYDASPQEWLIDIDFNTHEELDLQNWPENCSIAEVMVARELAMTCGDGDSPEPWWLPLDGSPARLADGPSHLPTTEDWVTAVVVP